MAWALCGNNCCGSTPNTANDLVFPSVTVRAMEPGWFLPSHKPMGNNYICFMHTLQCILIDDEPMAITALAYDLQRLERPKTRLLASFTQARDALDYLASQSGKAVDVIFLDIEMPDLDGLTFLDTFAERSFEVIFTTAHSRYAIEAIRKDAFDYLVKPINRDDLRRALERLVMRRATNTEEHPPLLPETPPFMEAGRRIRLE